MDQLDRLRDLTAEQLARVHDFVLQMEMERLWAESQASCDEGDLSAKAVEEAKQEYRSRVPYAK